MLENPQIFDPPSEAILPLPTRLNRALTVQIHNTVNGEVATIAVSGPFDFNAHRKFCSACEEALKMNGVTQIQCDMNNVEYLDSSALGLLLLLRDRANNAHRQLLLSNCKGLVLRTLEVANFNKLFTITKASNSI